MSYMHIENLYKNTDILLFKECYALEKIHGTSAHVSWKDGKVHLFSGGVSMLLFVDLFDKTVLAEKLAAIGKESITLYGEAYGGKCQAMSGTYGKSLRFVAFEALVDDAWWCVPAAEKLATDLGLDFVPYRRVPAEVEALNAERDRPSEQAVKCGIDEPRKREGIVIRPILEVRKSNGERIIAKHKAEEFGETKTPHDVDPDKRIVLEKAQAIADEWVTPMRLSHVLDCIPKPHDISQTGTVINAMVDDVVREAKDEIVDSKDARRAIGTAAAKMFKALIQRTNL